MRLSLNFKNILAFLALLFVCHELHELAHTAVAYMQCGCWGERDFNVWQICRACSPSVNTIWATLAGPLLTYSFIWIGFILLGSQNRLQWHYALGWALLFANKPFARIFTVAMRGGDESVIIRALTEQSILSTGAWMAEVAIVLILTIPVLIRAWRLLQPEKRALIFTAFLLGPMLIEFALMHKLGNLLLARGFLAEEGILGSPVLVNIWNGFWLIMLLFTFRYLTTILIHPKEKEVVPKEILAPI